MPNRFTEDLLCMQAPLVSIAVSEILGVQDMTSVFFNYWWPVADEHPQYIEISDTMICLFAAMSDEDINELIINWKE